MSNLSQSVMEEIGDVLGLYDRVGDGKLAVSDIYSALRALGNIVCFYFSNFFEHFSYPIKKAQQCYYFYIN